MNNINRKYILIFIGIVFLLPMTVNAQSIGMESNLNIPIFNSLTGKLLITSPINDSIGGVDVTVIFNPNIVFIEQNGISSTDFPTLNYEVNNITGKIRIIAISTSGLKGTSSINIKFSTSNNSCIRCISPINITLNEKGLINTNGTVLTPKITNRTIQITEAPLIKVDNFSIPLNGYTNVPVILVMPKNNTGNNSTKLLNVAAIDMIILYNSSVITASNVTLNNFSGAVNNTVPGTIRIVSVNIYGKTSDSTIATVKFTTSTNKTGSISFIYVLINKIANSDGDMIVTDVHGGFGKIIGLKKGDLNHNGVLDVVDVLFAAQGVIGTRSLSIDDRLAGDVNNDNSLDIIDILFIAQGVAGIRNI